MAALAGDTKIELADGGYIPGATRIVDEAYDYTDADQIGEGTYGKVYKGTDKQGDKVALKMIRMDNEKEGFPITAIREIKLLSTLKHENIVNLREIVRSRVNKESKYKGDIFMVFDYAEHDLTGLMDAVKQKQSLTIPQIKCIMLQLLKGLAYCHSNGILHRDLKASNLLIDRHGTLKIADFGLARNFANNHDGRLTNRVITLWYRPPELLLGSEKYGPEVDVWSVGCIFAELLAKKPLFPGTNEASQMDWIFKMMGVPMPETWPGVDDKDKYQFYKDVKTQNYNKDNRRFKDWCAEHRVPADAQALLNDLLALNPANRIKAMEATQHDYFWHQEPKPCKPSQLPKLPDCHEWTSKAAKKKQQEEQRQRQQQGGHHGHHHGQHQQHYGHHPGGYMPPGVPPGGPVAPYVMPPGMHPGPPAAAAAAYATRPGDRNVRQRLSGGGGPPPGPVGYGAPPRPGGFAPPGAGGGFNPGAARAGPVYPPGPGGYPAPGGYGAPAAGGYPPGPGMQRGPPGPQGRQGWQQQQQPQGYQRR